MDQDLPREPGEGGVQRRQLFRLGVGVATAAIVGSAMRGVPPAVAAPGEGQARAIRAGDFVVSLDGAQADAVAVRIGPIRMQLYAPYSVGGLTWGGPESFVTIEIDVDSSAPSKFQMWYDETRADPRAARELTIDLNASRGSILVRTYRAPNTVLHVFRPGALPTTRGPIDTYVLRAPLGYGGLSIVHHV